MSMQMLSAAARGEEAEAAGGFPDGAPWPGGHTEGLPRSPCQPQTGTPWPPLLQAWSVDQPYGHHLGICSKAKCRPHLRAQDSVAGQGGIHNGTAEENPLGVQ